MADQAPSHPKPTAAERRGADIIHKIEQIVYLMVAVLLVLSLTLALLGAAALLWNGVAEFTATEPVYRIIDRLLFVLMMVEILHTVHASIRTGTLLCEPFLIVGLIACIRRVLVITLETSQLNQPEKWDIGKMPLFQANMIELGVLAGLIAVLVASIRLTRPSDLDSGSEDEAEDKMAA